MELSAAIQTTRTSFTLVSSELCQVKVFYRCAFLLLLFNRKASKQKKNVGTFSKGPRIN